ncbi:MAG TPA: CapA family protein [Jiangellaceae bacterium]|nr:CapA family protein [Jiangellaceae bacterium]
MAGRQVRVSTLSVVLAVVGMGACAVADEPDRDVTRGTGAAPATEDSGPAAAPTVDATITAEPQPITIAFAGDVHFEGALEARLDDPQSALAPIAPQLSAADLTIVNLETAVGVGGRPEPKRFTFQAPPTAFEALAAAGVDAVTMANNHAGDYGRDGIRQALEAANAAQSAANPLAVIGIGHTADEAFAPATFEVGATTVAVLGASAADEDPTADPTGHLAATDTRPGTADAVDPTRLIRAVDQARTEADVVVVYLHWGVQGQSCPSQAQTELARTMAGAGADVVVGSHTHRLQGAGMLGDTFVAYGLGNFAWYTQASDETTATGVLTVTFDGGAVADHEWAPAVIGSDGLPHPVSGAGADQMTEDLAQLATCADLEPLAR